MAASWTLPPDVVSEILGRAHAMGVLQDDGARGSDEAADHEEAVRILRLAEAADDVPEAADMLRLVAKYRGEEVAPVETVDTVDDKGAVAEMMARERFPVPPEIEGDPPEMPRDLTAIGDRACRKLHSEFNAWLARVQYLIGVERSDQAAAEALAERHVNLAYRDIEKTDEAGKRKSAAALKAEAETDAEAIEWKQRAAAHGAKLTMLYSLRDIYAGNVERLSRDWRMRRDEFDMTGGK